MITKSYLIWPQPLWMHSMSLLDMHKRSLELHPTHPLWNALPLFNQLVFHFGKCGSWEGSWWYTHYPRLSQGVVDRRWIGTRNASKRVCHDQLANLSVSYCSYAGIVLLEVKHVSNSLNDWHDMWVKAFTLIALAWKWPLNYYAN